MSKETVQTIIGRAILEPDYRSLLFTDPAKALEGYDLTEAQTQSLKTLDQEKFDEAASLVDQRISKTQMGIFLKIDGIKGEAQE